MLGQTFSVGVLVSISGVVATGFDFQLVPAHGALALLPIAGFACGRPARRRSHGIE